MNRHVLLALPFALLFLVASAALWAWTPQPNRSHQSKPSGLVRTAPASHARNARSLRVSGVTRARDHATLSFSVPARLASRPVNAGQRVRKGQRLASVDAAQFQHAVSAADAALAEVRVRFNQAQRDLERIEQLHRAGAIADGQVEQARALVEGLDAARAAAAAQRSDALRLRAETTLLAPFDGTVTAVGLEPGELAAPGYPVVQISGDGPLQLPVELPESAAMRVRDSMAVRVELPFADGHVVAGRVANVARAAAGPGRLFSLVVDLDPDDRVVAGMSADAVLDLGGDDGVCVPLRAVLNPGSSRPFVFLVRDGKADRVDVQLDELLGSCVVVRGPIAEADRVVVDGHTSLMDGDAIREVL